ncbi:hypothetical protein GGR54DRAFT_654024 [Hypoxylon sp. NC1633]|nr:hypothetical protein GGR54DRAFT_654024 [Hypoxylon sp. NC1633]
MTKPEHRGLEADFLDLREMQRLSVESAERKKKIIERCNWYMFSSARIRGDNFRDSAKFLMLCRTAEAQCPPEQEKPNRKLSSNPPSDAFLARYHKACSKDSKAWLSYQDLVPARTIQDILAETWSRWQGWQGPDSRRKRFEKAIDRIPSPERITKIVCLGFGNILSPLPRQPDGDSSEPVPRNIVRPMSLAQHIAAIALAKLLEAKTRRQISLYTADPDYGAQHREALETLPLHRFVVLDPGYGRHEQFTVIDDTTVVFNMAGPPECPALRIIQEFARPVAIITSEVPSRGPSSDRLWFEVTEEDGTKVQIPGCGSIPSPNIAAPYGCPKRVRDMMAHEYYVENRFPVEEERDELKWGVYDKMDYGRQNWNRITAGLGGHWFTDTRLYVRKTGLLGLWSRLGGTSMGR